MTPEPLRVLFPEGRAVWDRIWSAAVYETTVPAVVELVQVVCEQVDERVRLRLVVFRDGSWRDRAALRALDLQLMSGLTAIADRMNGAANASDSVFDDLLAALGDPT